MKRQPLSMPRSCIVHTYTKNDYFFQLNKAESPHYLIHQDEGSKDKGKHTFSVQNTERVNLAE